MKNEPRFAPGTACGPYKKGDMIPFGCRLVSQLVKGGFGEVWKATAAGAWGSRST